MKWDCLKINALVAGIPGLVLLVIAILGRQYEDAARVLGMALGCFALIPILQLGQWLKYGKEDYW